MTLIIYPYIREEQTGRMLEVNELPSAPYNESFGFESWRTKVWGSDVIESFKCKLLPSLKDGNLYVEGENLLKLKMELEHIRKNLKIVSTELDLDYNTIQFRVCNAMEAIRIANNYNNAGVAIE